MLEKILEKLVRRILRKRLSCFYQGRFSYTEQFHNRNQNCLIAFPMNLTVCVEELGTVYSELQYCITPTYSRC